MWNIFKIQPYGTDQRVNSHSCWQIKPMFQVVKGFDCDGDLWSDRFCVKNVQNRDDDLHLACNRITKFQSKAYTGERNPVHLFDFNTNERCALKFYHNIICDHCSWCSHASWFQAVKFADHWKGHLNWTTDRNFAIKTWISSNIVGLASAYQKCDCCAKSQHWKHNQWNIRNIAV